MKTLLALLLSTIPCLAQAGRAEISGSVQDPSHLGVDNAKIEVEEEAKRAAFE